MLAWAWGAEERAVEPGAFTVLLVVPQIVALDSPWDFEATSNCYECLRATDCTGLCGAPCLSFCALRPWYRGSDRESRLVSAVELDGRFFVISQVPCGVRPSYQVHMRRL